VRLGVVREWFNAGPQVDAVMVDALAALTAGGAELVDPVGIPSLGSLGDAEFQIMQYELKADMAAYLESRGASSKYKSLADLIRFNVEHKDREMPWFGQEVFELAERKGPLSRAEYLNAVAACRRASREEGMDRALARHKVDALIAPTGGPAWTTDLVNGDHFTGGSSALCAMSGYPAITVPAGNIRGLPVGLTFMGPAWSEGLLIRLAYAFEQAVKARQAPRFLPTVTL
jgi:amidase